MNIESPAGIPRSWSEVSPEWLSSVLEPSLPGIVVSSVRLESLHEGTASTFRLHLGHDQSAPEWPATICMKSDIGLPHAERVTQSGIYRKEALVYRDVLPATAARAPHCHSARYDEAGRAYILLEDIVAAGGRFCSPADALSPAQVQTGVEQLARLHAATWHSPVIEERQWMHHDVSLGERDPLWNMLFDRFDDCLAEPHIAAVARVFHQADVIRDAFNRLRLQSIGQSHSLIHGDAHVGNFYTDRTGAMGLADFQCVQHGPVTLDLAMLIGSALDPVDRRAHERDLIGHYADVMRSLVATPPDFEELWLGYRRQMLYALVVWMFTTREYQAERTLIANVFRYGTAALDLDTLAVIAAH